MMPDVRALTIATDDGVVLSGTAVVPPGHGNSPGVLLLGGSGPLDRDSNMPGQRLDVSSTFAVALGALGIASLRFDKRGVAASSGHFASAGFADEANDAAAALAALQSLEGIDSGRVGVIGHSVGATIAARLAAVDSDVAFLVLLGCASSPGADVMAWQTEQIAVGLPGPSWLLGQRFRRRQAQHLKRIEATTEDVIRLGEQDIPARWMREYRAHDPLIDLAAVRCPVLAITGGKDIQVDPADVERIAAAVNGRCTTAVPDDLTHVLRSSRHKPSITRYSKLLQQPVDHDLVEAVSAWTLRQTKQESTSDTRDDKSV